MTAPRIAMPEGKPEFGTVFFVYRAKMHTGSSMHTAGAITEDQHRAISLILQGKTAIYDGEQESIVEPANREPTMTRDCTHGQLARSCNICDLEQEVDSLKARLAEVESASTQQKTVHRGQIITLKSYGRVRFDRLDVYFGQTTAKLTGIDHPNTYYPFPAELEREGYTIIDA